MLRKEPPLILRQIWVADHVAFEVGTFSINTEKSRGPRHTVHHKAKRKGKTVPQFLWWCGCAMLMIDRLRPRAADLAATGQSLSVRRSRRQAYSGDACRRNQSLFRKARSVGISCFFTERRKLETEEQLFLYFSNPLSLRTRNRSMTDGSHVKPETYALDRFEAVRGKADIKGRTDKLMAELRGDGRCRLTSEACPGNRQDPGVIVLSD